MRRHLVAICTFTITLCLAVAASAQQASGPPPTRTDTIKETLHGTEIADPYRWLEDGKHPETRTWIDAQIKYTEAVLGRLPGRDALRKRISELVRVDTMSAPTVRSGHYFFSKRDASQDLPVFYVRHGFEGKDEVLLDTNTLSPDKTVNATQIAVAEDASLWVYGIRQGGEDETTIQVMDVATHKDLADRLPKARYFGVSLKPDKSGFFYSRMNAKEGPRVYYHTLGTDPTMDTEIFGKGYGPDKIINASLTADGRWLLLTVLYGSAARKTELYVKDVAKDGPITAIVNDIDARFAGRIGGDTLFLQTNWKAPNGRLLSVDLQAPAKEKWREIVPETKSVMESVSLAGGKLFVSYLENVSSKDKIFAADGKHLGDVPFPGIGTGGVSGRWESNEAFLSFTNFVTPNAIHRYDTDNGAQKLWFRPRVPFESEDFEVKQVRYRSKDGAEVPMFLVHLKKLKLDGGKPTFLTGYGGFNISRTPSYSALVALWVEAGGVYALPSLRGGGEFGEEWHRAGMLEKKQNTFDDFIAAAEWLIANGYTKPEKLAIAGGSNGGLLVGAALTQRPELFRAVVCSVPLLDMVRYHKFLVARFWVPEYGSAEDPEQFKYIHAYSPYHRVKAGTNYPSVLFMTGDSDTRVDPLHARKMAALLQSAAAAKSDRPILLHYDTKSGHAGGKPVSKTIDDMTDEFSFLFWQLGMKSDIDSFDQSKVPIEVQPQDPSLKKIVVIAGRPSHGPGDHEFFAGCALLMKVLQQTPGVFPVMARDGWPKDPKTLENAKAVVFYMDGGNGHPLIRERHLEVVRKLMDDGVGFVNLHYAVEYPKTHAPDILKWLGGYYETGFSTNPHWKADFQSLPNHPITRGVKPFAIQDEWYFNIRFSPDGKGITPILKATPPDNARGTEAAKAHAGREEIVAWALERAGGGRSFGFTGGHFHRNWGDENFRRLVVNAILWSGGIEVPKDGARVLLEPDDIKRNMDRKGR